MEQKSLKDFEKLNKISHPLERPTQRYAENTLTPVSLSGIVVPCSKLLNDMHNTDFKLVCSSGFEYFIITDNECRDVFTDYRWEPVKVIGLLNASNMTIIPQKVLPQGPNSDKQNFIDLKIWKNRKLINKLATNAVDLVLIPAAICAVMVS